MVTGFKVSMSVQEKTLDISQDIYGGIAEVLALTHTDSALELDQGHHWLTDLKARPSGCLLWHAPPCSSKAARTDSDLVGAPHFRDE